MITDQEITALGEQLVDALMPAQKQLLLKSIINRLAQPADDGITEPVEAPLPVENPQRLPLPRNMSPDTAQKLASARRIQVDAELNRRQGLDKDFAQKLAVDNKTTPPAPKVDPYSKPLPNNPRSVVEQTAQMQREREEQEAKAKEEAEEEEKLNRLLEKRAQREREKAKTTTANTEAPAAQQPVRVKTLAEAVGPARKDEIEAANFAKHSKDTPTEIFSVAPTLNNESNPLPPAKSQSELMSESLCPMKLREPQPAGYRPYDLLKAQITAYCKDPNLKNGADVLQRFIFDMKDTPTVRVENALLVGFDPLYVLGRHLDGSPTKFHVGFVHPSEKSVGKALTYIKQVIDLWADGGEFEMKREAPGNAKRNLENVNTGDSSKSGMRVVPAVTPYEHHPRVYIFRPHDDEHQVAVVIA